MEDGGMKIPEGGHKKEEGEEPEGRRTWALTYVKRIGVGREKSRRQRAWKPSSSQLQVAVYRSGQDGEKSGAGAELRSVAGAGAAAVGRPGTGAGANAAAVPEAAAVGEPGAGAGAEAETAAVAARGPVQLRAQVLNRDRALLRLNERGLARGPVMGPERGQERPLYPVPLRLLLQMPEQGSLKGQARVQASPLRGCHFQRVRSNERRMQNLQRQERESA
jgi:hypothetical protein